MKRITLKQDYGRELFKRITQKVGVKEIVRCLNVCDKYVYAWISDTEEDISGKRSPIERTSDIINFLKSKELITDAKDILEYLNSQLFGHYIPDESLLGELIKQFEQMRQGKLGK